MNRRSGRRSGRCWYCGERTLATAAFVHEPAVLRKLCDGCAGDPDIRAEVTLRGFAVVRHEQKLERAR